jgi:hypothetical protein
MFTKANLEIYNIDVEDIITASADPDDKLPEDEFDS